MSDARGTGPPPSVEGRPPVPPAHVVLWAALGGAVLGPLVLFADGFTWDGDDFDRTNEGPFVLWTTLIAAQTMAWVLALPAIVHVARRWRTEAAVRSRELRLATAALILVALAVAVLPPLTGEELAPTVPHRPAKLALLNLGAFALAIAAARAMWFAAAAVRSGERWATDEAAIAGRRTARADLELLLGVLGTLVSLAVLASAALRGVMLDVDKTKAIPAQSVVAYGVTLSVVLGLVFVPAYLTVLRSGQDLRDDLAPLVGPDDPAFEQRLRRREELDELLGLNVSASTTFRAGIAILAPLLGSLTSLIPDLGG